MRALRVMASALLFLAAALAAHAQSAPQGLEPGFVPTDHVMMPGGPQSSVVFLISDMGGWSAREQAIASSLAGRGTIVVGIDLDRYYAALAEDDDCIYMVSDIERLTGQLYRAARIETYTPPVVAGLGAGATLALAIAAQTPPSTISATIAVDPGRVVPLAKQLCTPAPKAVVENGIAYGLTPGPLPNPVRIVFSSEASGEGREHAAELQKRHRQIEISEATGTADAILLAEIGSRQQQLAASRAPLDLPIVEIPATARYDTMAIIYSGDGGWRDIDKQLAAYLREAGVPVVGVDALRYFWHERQPVDVAQDLSRIIARYRGEFGTRKVMLIGYSFGANILPATYRLLPQSDKDKVSLISLLALSHQADFEIAVTGWLGFAGEGRHGDPVDDLQEVEPKKIQCIYGLDEDDTACPALQPLAPRGAEIVARPGGHHFDGNYRVLSDLIVARAAKFAASN